MSEVKIESEVLEALTKQIKDLTTRLLLVEGAEQGSGRPVSRQTSERKVTVLFVDGKPIIGRKNVGSPRAPLEVYEVVDPRDPTKRYMEAHIMLLNPKTKEVTTMKTNWADCIREAEKRELLVKHTEIKQWEIEQGFTTKKEVMEYSTVETDVVVPVIIAGETRVYTVEIDGVDVKIHENFVNMSK